MSKTLTPESYGKNSKEIQKSFTAIMKKVYGRRDLNPKINERQGYIYCDDQVLNRGERKINAPNTKYDKENFDKIQKKLAENAMGGDKIALDILHSEYKIHLMPKPKYMLPVVKTILEKCEKDPKFKKLINAFKIAIEPNSTSNGEQIDGCDNDKNMANIVIYPILGRVNALKLVNHLHLLFSRYENSNQIAEDRHTHTPRFNYACNNLIYFCQGGGDLKNYMLKKGGRDLLSKNMTHYKGGIHLKIFSKECLEEGIKRAETEELVATAIKNGLRAVDKAEAAVVTQKSKLGSKDLSHVRIQFEKDATERLERLKTTLKSLEFKPKEGTDKHNHPILYLTYKEVSKMKGIADAMEKFAKKYKITSV